MPKESPLHKYENAEIKDFIMRFVHDKVDRKILYYRHVDGDTLSEIGLKIGRDYTTVWRRLNKAEKELFKHLPPD